MAESMTMNKVPRAAVARFAAAVMVSASIVKTCREYGRE